jgi:hypothetical protein
VSVGRVAVPEVLRIAEDRHDERVVGGRLVAQAEDPAPARREVLHVEGHENPEQEQGAPGHLAAGGPAKPR